MTPSKKRKVEAYGAEDVVLHRRTLRFAVSLATSTALPGSQLIGGHAIGESYWYRIAGMEVKEEEVKSIQSALDDMVKNDATITKSVKGWNEAVEYLEGNKQFHAKKLVETRASAEVHVHECDGDYRLILHPLLPSMGLLGKGHYQCTLKPYRDGFLAVYGNDWKDSPAIADSFNDHLKWGENATNISSVGGLNEMSVRDGEEGRKNYGMAAEFRQDEKLTQIARLIHERNSSKHTNSHVRVLAIAGPTSSGKTTFAHKLSIYLKNFGYDAKALSVDHYYLNLEDQPKFKVRKERNDVDYDSLESMDIELVSDHINRLIAGETVQTPQYDFISGDRVPPGHEFSLPSNGILIIEGIHALNPEYTVGIDNNKVFRVYISPLTTLQLDDFNVLKTTSHRLLRRMTRDYKFRGYSASHTLSKWMHVRRGEHKYIFTNQNNADYVMNSAMEHEIAVLKVNVEPLLYCVRPSDPSFDFAQELLHWLAHIAGWPEACIAHTSVFREFIGNGAFDKH